MKVWQHFRTITAHKILVMKGCFQIGLYKQGLLHDLSKYGPTEFLVGCRYYKGYMSPNNAERYEKGYSSAWLHHKGINKHHLEYWMDYEASPEFNMTGMKMPVKYVVEMVMDRIAASKVYKKEAYQDTDPWNYYSRTRNHLFIHKESRQLLETLLWMLAEEGEEKTFKYIKQNVLKK